ncbi:hypothetical protein RDI58_014709 [Solanum bulbocastanum]|uniref:Uncharacterized protein n=1 Tax=Solanum bulbocastanum TaxID=147425 RepID=A0AAN8TGG2_SOLBU
MRDTDSMEVSFERYLRNGQIVSMHSGIMGIGGSNPDRQAFRSRNIVGMVGGRPEATPPPDASSTLFVEGLPADCTRREVSHILFLCEN